MQLDKSRQRGRDRIFVRQNTNSFRNIDGRRKLRSIAPERWRAYERAEPDAIIADGGIAQPRQLPQIDQEAQSRQAEGENRHQLCPPAMTAASGFDASRSIASRRLPGPCLGQPRPRT